METKESPIEIPTEEFDRRFDDGEDITPYLDVSKARRPGHEAHPAKLDFQYFVCCSHLFFLLLTP